MSNFVHICTAVRALPICRLVAFYIKLNSSIEREVRGNSSFVSVDCCQRLCVRAWVCMSGYASPICCVIWYEMQSHYLSGVLRNTLTVALCCIRVIYICWLCVSWCCWFESALFSSPPPIYRQCAHNSTLEQYSELANVTSVNMLNQNEMKPSPRTDSFYLWFWVFISHTVFISSLGHIELSFCFFIYRILNARIFGIH